jgi:hypothetical protein
LQAYLFANPDVLFPGQVVQQKEREFYIEGRRIDLLFRVDDVRYIVEVKAVPLNREHVGQVAEYYGLMREAMKNSDFKMVLVAPCIPKYRSLFLEEIGIRCIEIPDVPSGLADVERLRKESSAHRKSEQAEAQVSAWLPQLTSIKFDDLVSSVTKQSLAISHQLLRDTVEGVRKGFSEYEILPVKMMRAESGHVICGTAPASLDSMPQLVRGGAWWGYAFGESEQMPKNAVPNISAEAMPWCLDLTVNAELLPSQEVMRSRIAQGLNAFDRLVKEHGGIQFQALLKLEHQPRTYHWIPLVAEEPGTWNGTDILMAYERVERDYNALRDSWIAWIEKHRLDLSKPQAIHMHNHNKQPNLALRLVRPFRRADEFWRLPYNEQRDVIVSECHRLKPLIDFLR